MPFLRTDSVTALRSGIVPGRRIFLTTTGSDTTGDGSRAAPYGTLTRAIQDLQSGNGDAVIMGPGTFTEAACVKVTGSGTTPISDFAIYGQPGATILRPPSTPAVRSTFTAIVRTSNSRVTFTTSAAHGFVVGDAVLIAGVTQTGTNFINGVHRVQNVPSSTQFRLELVPATLSNSFEPFLSSLTAGAAYPMALSLRKVQSVVIDGITFGADVLTDSWTGLHVDADVSNALTRDVFVARCTFGKGCVAFEDFGASPGINGSGTSMLIERCLFNPTLVGSIDTNVIADGVGNVYLRGMTEFRLIASAFGYLSNSGAPSPWSPTAVVLHTSTSPGSGYLFAANSFPADSGTTGISRTRLFKSLEEVQGSGAERIFARRNLFNGITTIQDVAMDEEGFLVDPEPNTIAGQDELQTQSDLVMRYPIRQAATIEGSVGQAISDIAYSFGGIHIDLANGVAGTVRGINGTPSNPVDSEADARTLADAVGIREYTITGGTLTLTQSHTEWTFHGRHGPASDRLNPGGQDCDGSAFEQLHITGTFGGAANGELNGEKCVVEDVTGFKSGPNGAWLITRFLGTVTLAGATSRTAVRELSTSIAGAIIDVNGNSTFEARDVAGFVQFDAMGGSSLVGLTLAGAGVTIGATSTGGIVSISGIHSTPVVNNGTPSVFDDTTIPAAVQPYVLSDATPFPGADIPLLTHHITARARIDTTTTPWTEVRYVRASSPPDTVVEETYELYDQDGVAIAGDHTAGNNPLFDSTRIIAERRRV